jgi:hypothetical protein
MRQLPCAHISNRHESETASCQVTEDRDLRIQARTRDVRRCSRPPHETAVGQLLSVAYICDLGHADREWPALAPCRGSRGEPPHPAHWPPVIIARSWAISTIGRCPSVGCTPENHDGLPAPTVQFAPATALPQLCHNLATAMPQLCHSPATGQGGDRPADSRRV